MEHPITILGAGIIGICTALELAERGLSVRVIDRGPPGQETSFGNAGVISPWSIIPQSMPGTIWQIPRMMFGAYKPLAVHWKAWPELVPWGLRLLRQGTEARARKNADAMSILCNPSVDLYRRHLTAAGAEHLLRDSMYVHAFRDGSKASLDALDVRIRMEKGGDLELVGADSLHRLEPALSRDFQAAILIKGQGRATSPVKVCQALSRHAASLGVTFETGTVQGLERRGSNWAVICDGSEYMAQTVVVAMGAWSRDLLKTLGVRVPLLGERGYHVEYSDPQVSTENSVMDTDSKVIASSMDGGLRVAGQAEFAPLDAPPTQAKFAHMRKLAKGMFPDLNIEGETTWMGRRPSFPDSLPALGPIEGHEGLIANFGHSHYGLMMAPKSAQLVAAHIAGSPHNEDLTPFRPHRFS
ncbi:MAG: FAD-dependent oxidoreductase [Pseudomonadota bacterium]